MATRADGGGGGGKLVMDYASMQRADRIIGGAHDTLEAAYAQVRDVGTETMHAAKLDEALATYMSSVRRASWELIDELKNLRSFLTTSQTGMAEIDHSLTAGMPWLEVDVPHATETDPDGTKHNVPLDDLLPPGVTP